DSDTRKTGPHHDLGDAALDAIRRSRHVSSVVPFLTAGALVVPCPGITPAPTAAPACRRRVDPYFGSLVGTDLTRIQDLPITVLAGRLPRPRSMNEVVVTQSYVERLGLDGTHPQTVLGT